jgi:hypothetical protein
VPHFESSSQYRTISCFALWVQRQQQQWRYLWLVVKHEPVKLRTVHFYEKKRFLSKIFSHGLKAALNQDHIPNLRSIYHSIKSYIDIFRNGKNPHYTENIYSCGLNVLLDPSGHSIVEIICFFIMSGLKYHPTASCSSRSASSAS